MTAYRAVRTRAAVRGGETVAVVGLGGVGLSAVEIANALGAQVIAIDRKPEAFAAARKLGAIEVIDSTGLTPMQVADKIKAFNGGLGVAASIDAIGANNGTLTALDRSRKVAASLQWV